MARELEGTLYDGAEPQPQRRYQRRDRNNGNKPQWRVLEVVVRENAAVEVCVLDLQVPRFSFRVGTAHFPKYDGDPVTVSQWLTSFNARDAVDLLSEVETKYTEIREKKIEEMEERKRRAIRNTNNPEVMVRRRSPPPVEDADDDFENE